MDNMNEENNRSEYPADRIIMDIFELIQAMSMINFSHSIYWSNMADCENVLSVSVWDNDSPSHIVVSCANYSDTETDSLNVLYEKLWCIYKQVNPIQSDDVCPF